MGCSTFAEYTVIAEISAAIINKNADLKQSCLNRLRCCHWLGCCYEQHSCITGNNSCRLGFQGAVGLSVIQAAKIQGAGKIYGIDLNEQKFDIAKKFGADVCYKPTP